MTFLDTHVVVWLYQRDKHRFSELALQILDGSQLCISSMVSLELEYLFEIGRITEKNQKIISYLKRSIGLKIDDCTFHDLVEVAIENTWTRDPFDRIITAHAALHNAILLTKDATIREHYPHARW